MRDRVIYIIFGLVLAIIFAFFHLFILKIMGKPYIFPIFILILNIYLIIVLRLKRMPYIKSLKKLESKIAKVFIFYSIGNNEINVFKKWAEWTTFPILC